MRDGRPRIVFNALPLDPDGGGVSTYIRALLGGLAGQVEADLVAAVRPGAVDQLPPGVAPLVAADVGGARRALRGAVGFGPADLVHGLDVDLPLRHRSPAVATVHDLAVFDQAWAFPRLRVAGEQWLVRSSLRRADAVVAVSRFTADRVEALTGRRAVVVHSAPSPAMVPAGRDRCEQVRLRYRLPDRFVLHVGNIEPRKDIATLAAACRACAVPLVLTGTRLWGHEPPAGTVEVGHVPLEDLPALYGAATLVGYASRYEGFGLPPLEAMACGAPVVSTPVPAVTELVPDGAATFRPGDVDGLGALLAELLDDEERRLALARRGAGQVAGLTWERTAAATADVYRSLGLRL